jgi:hypothetical protein
MSLLFGVRRAMRSFPQSVRRLLRLPLPHSLVPLTFEQVNRRRRELRSDLADRAPCPCCECRHARRQQAGHATAKPSAAARSVPSATDNPR